MFWYILTGIISGAGGFILCGILCSNKVSELQDALTTQARSLTAYDLLRARVRGIQQHGVKVNPSYSDSDYAYVVQKPNGKFGKFTLPGV